ncbi:MAG: dienelactone hydrolase family protein [Planctomycetes bacterium]|nr:dienelactone hydrolase family protein [Planctomycetota bacterium]
MVRVLNHWRFEVVALACWACANLLMYWNLDEDPTGRLPTRAALKLYHPVRSGTLQYRLMAPVKNAGQGRYPLVCFLHGAGERGDDNRTQLIGLPEQLAEAEWRRKWPCFVLAPQCPESTDWTSLDEELLELIGDVSNRYPIDLDRVYLTGLSMGGFGSWSLASQVPDRFAAVVPICGGGDPQFAKELVDVPIWAIHGDADRAVDVKYSRQMIAAIRAAGGQPHYTELRGVGHDSWTQSYRAPNGVLKWMFEQRNSRRVRTVDP